MGRLMVAFRLFFRTLWEPEFATDAELLLQGELMPIPPLPKSIEEKPFDPEGSKTAFPTPLPLELLNPPAPSRQAALTLLATLQREGRFLDFVKESLEGVSDEQLRAVVTDVHRDCAATLERLFAIRPLLDTPEGESLEIKPGFDAAKYRLTGHVSGQPPYRGTLCHNGWQATRCELAVWSGPEEAARVLAPAEVEIG